MDDEIHIFVKCTKFKDDREIFFEKYNGIMHQLSQPGFHWEACIVICEWK